MNSHDLRATRTLEGGFLPFDTFNSICTQAFVELMNIPFKVVFLAHAPDADPEKHRSVIDTGKYKLYSVVVKTQAQAVEECKKLVEEEGIQSILLCPGFTHKNIYEIVEAVKMKAGVSVARGDGPSSRIATLARKENYGKK